MTADWKRGGQPKSMADTILEAESRLLSTAPGAVPPHLDTGGHLPFGGTLNGGTAGKSAFGKRKIVTADSNGSNPQALMLNFPPEPTEENLKCWAKNYKSSICISTSAEDDKDSLNTTTHLAFGKPDRESYLVARNHTYGDLRQQAFSRPQPSPAFYPPERDVKVPEEETNYEWEWPERPERRRQPQLVRPTKVEHKEFMEEYNLRPPWLKY
mmetsp:Transcript_12088/g.34787  ORF Transcript_12088/g.34787 Transcript_12088/m.34787 type:complete len:212 (+) Transcript_12088:85-720(+)|eukprot:scaffold266604_cov35-Tisochrysis_lutea.AAC.1